MFAILHNKKMENHVQWGELEGETIYGFKWQWLTDVHCLFRITGAAWQAMTMGHVSFRYSKLPGCYRLQVFLILLPSVCVNLCDWVWCCFSAHFLSCSPIALSASLVSKMSSSACESSIWKLGLWWTEVMEVTQIGTACNLFLVVCIDGTTYTACDWMI